MTPQDISLSPMVQCGPEGLQFMESVVLSFPHSASCKYKQVSALMRHDDPTEGEWEEFDGKAMVFLADQRVFFLVDHFTRFKLSGTPPDGTHKSLTLGAFGPDLDPTSNRYRFRVRSWNSGDVETEKIVKEREKEMNAGMMDDLRNIVFFWDDGDLVLEVTGLDQGWRTCGPSQEQMMKEQIERFASNSVTFDLTQQAAASSATDASLYCRVLSYQILADEYTRSWNNVRFSIRPELNEREHRVRRDQTIHCTCDRAAGAACGDLLCAHCKEQIQRGIHEVVVGEVKADDFGGLPEETVRELCIHLEQERDGNNNWIQLAETLSDSGHDTIVAARRSRFRAKDLLKIYFGRCRAVKKNNAESVEILLENLRKIPYDRAVEIIEEGLKKLEC